MCLQRWSFCNLAALGSQQDTYSWKRYFLRRSVLEANMTKGRTGSYKCKSLRGHTGALLLCLSEIALRWISWSHLNCFSCPSGSVVGLVYLHGNSSQNPKLWNTGATVCSASSDCTLRAWNVQNVSRASFHQSLSWLFLLNRKVCVFPLLWGCELRFICYLKKKKQSHFKMYMSNIATNTK